MKVAKNSNGKITVTHENLTLIHTDIKGVKFNDCSINMGEYTQLTSESDPLFKPLFTALHNFKYNSSRYLLNNF